MYQIGEFSHLCETIIKSFIQYDKINLLKPSKINESTGYRYYSNDQINKLQIIKDLQFAGFSLKEIKKILNEENHDQFNKQIEKLKKENEKKIMILQKMKNNMTKKKVELITNPNFLIVGKITTIKNREQITKIINNINKKNPELQKYNQVIEIYEKGFKEKNINCFIGKILPDYQKDNYSTLINYKKKKLEILNNNKVKTMLHSTVENTITETYKEMIEYANKNNIQIRGNFQEVYQDSKIDIYVEAYDLTKENEDELQHRKKLKDNIKNIYPKKFIGTWTLQGEITELPKYFNPLKKHFYPDTKYEILELNKDGSTNFNNITWKEKYIIIREYNITNYSALHTPRKKLLNTYMTVLINQKESNARPYEYYYKKIK